jgi:hypothetical protein
MIVKDIKLKYNFTALRLIEENGISLAELEEGVGVSALGVLVFAGMYGADKNVTKAFVDDVLDDIIEEMGFKEGMEYISKLVSGAFGEKK